MCGTWQPEGSSTILSAVSHNRTRHNCQHRNQQNIEQITMRNNYYPSAHFYYHVMLDKNYIKRYNILHLQPLTYYVLQFTTLAANQSVGMQGSVYALTTEKCSGPKAVAFFELSCTRLSVLCPSRVFLHARICIMYAFFMHGTFACLDMESLMLAAQMMTPTSSWALAQIFLLGHEVP